MFEFGKQVSHRLLSAPSFYAVLSIAVNKSMSIKMLKLVATIFVRKIHLKIVDAKS